MKYCEIGFKFHFFPHAFLIIPEPFTKMTVLSCHICSVISQVFVYTKFPGFHMLSHWSILVYPRPKTPSLKYYSFI